MIERLALNRGDVVLDLFCGSGVEERAAGFDLQRCSPSRVIDAEVIVASGTKPTAA